MKLTLLNGGKSDSVELNQEIESIENRMAEVRWYSGLSPSQRERLKRMAAMDPLEAVEEIIIEANELHERMLRA